MWVKVQRVMSGCRVIALLLVSNEATNLFHIEMHTDSPLEMWK